MLVHIQIAHLAKFLIQLPRNVVKSVGMIYVLHLWYVLIRDAWLGVISVGRKYAYQLKFVLTKNVNAEKVKPSAKFTTNVAVNAMANHASDQNNALKILTVDYLVNYVIQI